MIKDAKLVVPPCTYPCGDAKRVEAKPTEITQLNVHFHGEPIGIHCHNDLFGWLSIGAGVAIFVDTAEQARILAAAATVLADKMIAEAVPNAR